MSDSETQFACKEEGCDQQVTYAPEAIPGLIYDRPAGLGQRTRTVYLTCDDGHTHPYQV
jgi:hypothetical protein